MTKNNTQAQESSDNIPLFFRLCDISRDGIKEINKPKGKGSAKKSQREKTIQIDYAFLGDKEHQLYYCNEANPKKKECKIAAGNIVASLITHFVEKGGYDLQKFKSLFKPGKVEGDNNQTYSINNGVITIANSYQKLPDILQKILYFPAKTQNEENSLDEDSKRINELVKSELILQFHYVEGGKGKEFMKKLVGGVDKIHTRDSIWGAENPQFQLNRIIFGAPGTGKSYQANLDANELLLRERKEDKALDIEEKKNKADHLERVTFHPEYTYFDFVGSYKPVMNGENIQYKFVAGPFARMLRLALDAQKNNAQDKFCLIVEEINRARVAAVFGDIFQLLDRKENGESVYEIMPSLELFRYLMHDNNQVLQDEDIKPIRIPSNLFIWATMNSADQGVYTMDTAFKRRWSFKYIGINDGEDDVVGKDEDVVSAWKEIRARINNLLQEAKVNEDKQLGPFFLHGKELEDGVSFLAAFKSKVLMYLYEDAARHKRNEIFKTEGIRYSELCADADKFCVNKDKSTSANYDNLSKLFKPAPHAQPTKPANPEPGMDTGA